ncbi:MAG: hypothetical protein WBY75_10965 [Terracidiphilus sp.]
MGQINRLLLVENESKDLRFATDTALSVGISGIEARTSVTAARDYLEKGLNGEVPLPDGIVLDLDLGYESGYELLRFWHCSPRLSTIPLIVWSILGDHQREICKLFNVNAYVGKWEGAAAFREALARLEMTVS